MRHVGWRHNWRRKAGWWRQAWWRHQQVMQRRSHRLSELPSLCPSRLGPPQLRSWAPPQREKTPAPSFEHLTQNLNPLIPPTARLRGFSPQPRFQKLSFASHALHHMRHAMTRLSALTGFRFQVRATPAQRRDERERCESSLVQRMGHGHAPCACPCLVFALKQSLRVLECTTPGQHGSGCPRPPWMPSC